MVLLAHEGKSRNRNGLQELGTQSANVLICMGFITHRYRFTHKRYTGWRCRSLAQTPLFYFKCVTFYLYELEPETSALQHRSLTARENVDPKV